jgi:very-short-patch-repair endonuclease
MRNAKTTSKARQLRQRQTGLEEKLWQELRNRRTMGLKFRRQYPVGPYIADFACLEARLLFEIDGFWHTFRKAQDQARDEALKAAGFDVVRYDITTFPSNPHTLAEAMAHEERHRLNLPSPAEREKGRG